MAGCHMPRSCHVTPPPQLARAESKVFLKKIEIKQGDPLSDMGKTNLTWEKIHLLTIKNAQRGEKQREI